MCFGDGSGISQTVCKQSAPRSRHFHTNTSSLNFLQAGCPSWRPTNNVKALKAHLLKSQISKYPIRIHFVKLSNAHTKQRIQKIAIFDKTNISRKPKCGRTGAEGTNSLSLLSSVQAVPQTWPDRLASCTCSCNNMRVCATIRYDTRCYFNVRSKANMSQLNLPHGNRQLKSVKTEKKLKVENRYAQRQQ